MANNGKRINLSFFYVEKGSKDYKNSFSFNSKFGFINNNSNPLYKYTINEILNAIGEPNENDEPINNNDFFKGSKILNYISSTDLANKFFSNGIMIFDNKQFGSPNAKETIYLKEVTGSSPVEYNIRQLIDDGNDDTSGVLSQISAFAHFFYRSNEYRHSLTVDDVNRMIDPQYGAIKTQIIDNLTEIFKNKGDLLLHLHWLKTKKGVNLFKPDFINPSTNSDGDCPVFLRESWANDFMNIGRLNARWTVNDMTNPTSLVELSHSNTANTTFEKPENKQLTDRFGSVSFSLRYEANSAVTDPNKIRFVDNSNAPLDVIFDITMHIVPTNYVNRLETRYKVYIYEDDNPFSWGIDPTTNPSDPNAGKFAFDRVNAIEMSNNIVLKTDGIKSKHGFNSIHTFYTKKYFVKPRIISGDPAVPDITYGNYTPEEVAKEREALLNENPNLEYEQTRFRTESMFIFSNKKDILDKQELAAIVSDHLRENYYYYSNKYLNIYGNSSNSGEANKIKNNTIGRRLPKVYPELFQEGSISVFPIFSNGFVPNPSIQGGPQSKFIAFKNKSNYVSNSTMQIGLHTLKYSDIKDYVRDYISQDLDLDKIEIIHASVGDAKPFQGQTLQTLRHKYPFLIINEIGHINFSNIMPNYEPLINLNLNLDHSQSNIPDDLRDKIIFTKKLSIAINALTSNDTEAVIDSYNATIGQFNLSDLFTYTPGNVGTSTTIMTRTSAEIVSFRFANMIWNVYGALGEIVEGDF